MFGSKLNSILNWNVRLGRLFGIPIHLHITLLFFILPAFVGRKVSFGHAIEYALLVVLSILLHELGHALMAKRYRMTDLSIMLHGFGGFAASRGYRTPRQALFIVLAGPATTLVLGLLCWGVGNWAYGATSYETEANSQAWLVYQLGLLNLRLAVLNMIPALPWDGGNALQAVLAHRMPEIKATRAVAHLGLPIGFSVGMYGFVMRENYLGLFGLVAFLTCYQTLQQTGGIKFREFFDDRQRRKEEAAAKQRSKQKQENFLDEVAARERERKEQGRLRKLLGE